VHEPDIRLPCPAAIWLTGGAALAGARAGCSADAAVMPNKGKKQSQGQANDPQFRAAMRAIGHSLMHGFAQSGGGANKPAVGAGGSNPWPRDPVWKCPSCSANANFAWRASCRACGAKRDAGAEQSTKSTVAKPSTSTRPSERTWSSIASAAQPARGKSPAPASAAAAAGGKSTTISSTPGKQKAAADETDEADDARGGGDTEHDDEAPTVEQLRKRVQADEHVLDWCLAQGLREDSAALKGARSELAASKEALEKATAGRPLPATALLREERKANKARKAAEEAQAEITRLQNELTKARKAHLEALRKQDECEKKVQEVRKSIGPRGIAEDEAKTAVQRLETVIRALPAAGMAGNADVAVKSAVALVEQLREALNLDGDELDGEGDVCKGEGKDGGKGNDKDDDGDVELLEEGAVADEEYESSNEVDDEWYREQYEAERKKLLLRMQGRAQGRRQPAAVAAATEGQPST
jgi:hypothetical protein